MAVLETHRMREVIEGLTTVSDKIRALDKAGFPRADIARFLNKRYQHVRNVLIGPRPTTKNGGSEGPPTSNVVDTPTSDLKAKVQIGAAGRIVIPADMRLAMDVSEGDTLMARVIDGELKLMSQRVAVRRAQNLVRQFVPEGVSLVNQLIEERRSEAGSEGGR